MFRVFKKCKTCEELEYYRAGYLDMLRYRRAFIDATEDMYKEDKLTKEQFLELYNRYYNVLERLRSED